MSAIKTAILRELTAGQVPDSRITVQFSELLSKLQLSPEQLDKSLNELENSRFITQFALEKSDVFHILLHKKAFTTPVE